MKSHRRQSKSPVDGGIWAELNESLSPLSVAGRRAGEKRLVLGVRCWSYDHILNVDRTIADLAGSDRVGQPHLLEAIQYRSLDRNVFY